MEESPKGRSRAARLWSREALLLIVLVSLGMMFGIAQLAVGFYRTKQADLAILWSQRGAQALQAHHPKEAIEDLRNALSYAAPGSANYNNYQLRLAQALAADDRIEEAEAYLLDLWTHQPGSGEINLELAQLEARKNSGDAARYYDNAIYGVWEKDPNQRRWQTRLELFHYWLSRGNSGQAKAQLLALAAETPEEDFQRQMQIGQLQLEAGDPRQALEQFRLALRVKKRLPAALAGAGAAEFAIGEYRAAIAYLDEAVRANPKDTAAAAKLQVARLVLSGDPFEIGLGDTERADRTINAFLQAQSRLKECATQRGVQLATPNPQSDLQIAWARGQLLQPSVRRLRRQPKNVLQLMDFVFSAENLAARTCGPLKGKDQALWLIGKKHQLAEGSGQAAK
jgi:tetratricopeptide (TPR) repeat protein